MATAPALLSKTRPGLLYPHAQWYFLLAIAITWLGFSRTYFAVVRTEPLLHHIHGSLMGGWIALLILQPVLYQRGRMQLHRTLGRWGAYLLMPAIVLCGFFMDRRMLRMQNAPPSVLDQLAFLDLVSLILFPAMVLLSILYARNVQLHARYIVCTVLLFMPPALTRALFMLPPMQSFQLNVNTSEAIVVAVLLVLTMNDARRRSVWAPYPLAIVVFTGVAITSNSVKQWTWWHGVSGWLAGS